MKINPFTKVNLQRLGNNTLVYLVGLLISNALAFMIFPIVAKTLSKGEFGLLDFYLSIGILISVLMTFGIDSSIGRLLHEVNEHESRSRLITESILMQIVLMAMIISILYIFADLIVYFFNYDLNNILIFKLILMQASFQTLINISLNLLKWTFQKWNFIILSIFSTGIGLICISISVFLLNANLVGIIEAIIISKALSAVVAIYLIYNLIDYKLLSFDFSRRILKYALPIGIICILEVTIPVIERNFILVFFTTEELGQYAALAKFVAILSIVVQAFQSAWGPYSLSVHNQEMSNEGFVLIIKIYVLLICFCSLALLIVGKFLLVLLTSTAYQEDWFLMFPMSISLIIQSIGSIIGIGLIISNRPNIQLVNYVIYIIISCALIYLFTKQYGIIGAVCAILMANIIRAIIISLLSQYFYFIAWPFKIISIIIFMNLFSGIIITIFLIKLWYFLAIIFFFISMIFISYFFWIYALNDDERGQLNLNLLKSKLHLA